MPASTPTNRSSGSPIPNRWRGRARGSSSVTQLTIVPSSCLSNAPPMPYPSKSMAPKSEAALRRRSSYCAPWITPNSAWYGLVDRSAVNFLCSSMQRNAQSLVRSSDITWYSRVFMRVVSSSKANMMSAPSWCCTCMENSGVNRCIVPSK